ncbi:MAG: serine hydrolase [Flavobacterium sp.]|uniref:serine hydrolase n=1 Tax=Flavobacterium sp. TaxID=239 RepID=UPI0012117F6C|nr:serine hydrolase [Flavobacterium sp.]RZJ65179.1 MAG: serine hydrolase [Flavobacterium sp.]
MKKFNYFILVFIAMFLSTDNVAGQLTSSEVDALVTNAMEKFKVAGVAVAIVKDGKVIHEKGYGVKSIETKLPVDTHTNFQIASNSKAFTTAALAILVDEGKISWKDKVKTFIPEFKMYNEYVSENFLIEDLLCHRSGLGLGVGDLMGFPDGSDFTIKDVLASFQHFKPTSNFRTQFDYDNLLYWVAGEVVARASGMSWEEFVQTRIMVPLNMENSAASASKLKGDNIAMPHSTENENSKIKQISLFKEIVNGAAGGIFSNADDMSKWVITQLNQGKYGDNLEKKLFSPERQKEMWAIHTVMDVYNEPRYNQHFNGYGLGWFLSDVKGNLRVSHTGGLPGMLSQVFMIPDLKLGVVILTNTESGGASLFRAVNNVIVDSYLGLDKIDWVETYAARSKQNRNVGDSITTNVWKQVERSKKIKVNPTDYVGIYEDNWFGKTEVFLKGDQLWFKSHRSPKLNGPMRLYKGNTFAIKWEYQDMNCDALAIFSLDEEGKAQRIKMKGISPNIDFSFDFQDLDLVRK